MDPFQLKIIKNNCMMMFSQPFQYYHHQWPATNYPLPEEDQHWPPVDSPVAIKSVALTAAPAAAGLNQVQLRGVASEDYGYDSSDDYYHDERNEVDEEVFHLEMGDESDDEVKHEMTKILSPDSKQTKDLRDFPSSMETHQSHNLGGFSMGKYSNY